MTCCPPSQKDEDRTHTVRYRQRFYEEGQLVNEDGGTLSIECTHNDAVITAGLYAQSDRWNSALKPRGKNGTWMGSDNSGDGDRIVEEIYIWRGAGEIEYDENRASGS